MLNSFQDSILHRDLFSKRWPQLTQHLSVSTRLLTETEEPVGC